MSVQKIIQEAINKNPHDLKEALQEELRNRIALALEAKMSDDEEDDDSSEEDDEEDDEEDMKEEAEQIDELKKSTLASYVKKASGNVGMLGMNIGRKEADADEVDRMTNRHMPDKYNARDSMKKALGADSDTIRKVRNKAGNRIQGIERASDRLSKD